MLSGIHHLLIHPIATIAYTRFPPFETKMGELYVASSHLQTYAVASIFFPDSAHLHHRNGQVAMYLTFVARSLSMTLLTNIYTEYFVNDIVGYISHI